MTTLTDSWRSSGLLSLGSMRRWIRLDKPAFPDVLGGLLPAAGLAVLAYWSHGPFAFNDVEATARSEIRSQLDSQGHGWAQLFVTGQEVVLTGNPPCATAGDEALATARAATCPSAFGRLTCAVSVTGAFAQPGPTSPRPLAKAPAPALPPAASAVHLRTAAACGSALAEALKPATIAFASNSAQLDARSAGLIDELANIINTCPGQLRIEGHTDAQGSAEANRALSKERAAAVRAALITRGVVPGRLVARGFGADQPLGDNDTEAGRALNRRIAFQVITSDRP